MPFHPYSNRNDGGRSEKGGGLHGSNRFPPRRGNDNRRAGTQDKPSGHTTASSKLVSLLGGENFPECESPSLRLDKFVTIGDKRKLAEIGAVVTLHNRRKPTAPVLVPHGFRNFVARLRSNLIINQAGGVLENAGISLHPHFNVPILPGSAVKGVARHAAWCEWSAEKDETKKEKIANRIATVFGYPTGDARPKDGPRRGGPDAYLDDYLSARNWKDKKTSGTVVFMTAFPCNEKGETAPATLAVDILTPHGGNDWTDPVPNPFPVVAKDTSFKFVVGSVKPDGQADVEDAIKWLKKGLTQDGLGGKTAAGYGAFLIPGDVKSTPARTYTLRLVSPAFLRGAEKDEGVLREASLRGVLRYWWRILFGSVLVEEDLAKLEKTIWGGTGTPPSASQIAIRVVPIKVSGTIPFDKEPIAKRLPAPFRSKRFDKRQNREIVIAPGLAYASYGMDDSGRRRSVLNPGAEWRLEVAFRSRNGIDASALALHAELALKALCTFGGIGSKSRKGFGSLDCGMVFDIGDKKSLLAVLADALAPFGFTCNADAAGAYSFLSPDLLTPISVPIGTRDVWAAVDRIGFSLQTTASSFKHRREKAAAGLPRQIHGPLDHRLSRQQGLWNPPEKLHPDSKELRDKKRFASPLFVHVAFGDDGKLKVNAIAFPSAFVRTVGESHNVLTRYLDDLSRILSKTNW